MIVSSDCPYCGISNNYAGSKYIKTKFPAKYKDKYETGCLVKGRNEPCTIK